MIKEINRKKLNWKKVVAVIAAVILSVVVGFLIYASFYYKAEPQVYSILEENGTKEKDGIIVLESIDEIKSEIGIVFYPGAKVEAEAYLPLADRIRDAGYNVYIVNMPLKMAIFNKNAANKVMDKYSEIEQWYIMGHSMGGAMASAYAAENTDKIEGLILLGAYIYGDYPDSNSLTIYGSYNTDIPEHIDYDENIVEIKGGNHAQFGNYGKQKGDRDADISTDEQQKQSAEAIVEFIENR